MSLSVIVPFHRSLSQLRECVRAIAAAGRWLPIGTRLDIVLVANGVDVERRDISCEPNVRLLSFPGAVGPAVARNRGAAAARGDLLVFVDSDVIVHPKALARLCAHFATHPDLGAAFGAYDFAPAGQGLVSRCQNLRHAFTHREANREAETFWAGLGAVRADAFWQVGGFDERFTRSSVEDIDLGYRIRRTGRRILLDPESQGTHLKQWTFRSALMSDLRDRGIPWIQLMHRYERWQDHLNVTRRHRIAVVIAYLALIAAVTALWFPAVAMTLLPALAALWWLDHRYYRFLAGQLGVVATLQWFPLQLLHHLGNGVAVAIGTSLYHLRRSTGLACPGALPLTPWRLDGTVRRPSADCPGQLPA